MPRIMLSVGALLLASCGSSESDVLTDADIHQVSAPDKDIDRLDPELEPDQPPPSPEVSVAPLAMPDPTSPPDFDFPVTDEAKTEAQGVAKAVRDMDSVTVSSEPTELPPTEELVETGQASPRPSAQIQYDDDD